MSIIKRNKIAFFFLLIYLLWWGYMAWYIFIKSPSAEPGCDLSPVVFIYLTPVFTIVYSIIFLILALITKNPGSKDYLILTALVVFPLLPAVLYLMRII